MTGAPLHVPNHLLVFLNAEFLPNLAGLNDGNGRQVSLKINIHPIQANVRPMPKRGQMDGTPSSSKFLSFHPGAAAARVQVQVIFSDAALSRLKLRTKGARGESLRRDDNVYQEMARRSAIQKAGCSLCDAVEMFGKLIIQPRQFLGGKKCNLK